MSAADKTKIDLLPTGPVVESFNSRTGAVAPQLADYTTLMIPKEANFYSASYSGSFLSSELWLRPDNSLQKSNAFTYSGSFISTSVEKFFDTDGSTILFQTTTTYAYDASNKITNETTVRDVLCLLTQHKFSTQLEQILLHNLLVQHSRGK